MRNTYQLICTYRIRSAVIVAMEDCSNQVYHYYYYLFPLFNPHQNTEREEEEEEEEERLRKRENAKVQHLSVNKTCTWTLHIYLHLYPDMPHKDQNSRTQLDLYGLILLTTKG